MTSPVLRLGTRGSALATTQSRSVAELLAAIGLPCELVPIRTEGDVNTGPLAAIGGTGIFVTGVRAALLSGDVDVIVHSYKDLPTTPAPGIELIAVPTRENPFDALCSRDGLLLQDLPAGARVGTGSPRRKAQLLRLRPDLVVEPIRGNVDTRLRLVSSGQLDAVVLAAAGLARLGREEAITELFTAEAFLPAPAQGALAVECRAERSGYRDLLVSLDDPAARASAAAERQFLSVLEAGCLAPVGAIGTVDPGGLSLTGAVIAVDGSREVRGAAVGSLEEPETLGRRLAQQLLARGAGELLGVAR